MSDTLKIGKIITEPQKKDAVHMAIAPCEAMHDMRPGQQVKVENGKASPIQGKGIGIVDPFLSTGPCTGDKFWVFLYPGSITSLRHDWTHPDFALEPTKVTVDSGRWLAEFASDNGIDYDDLIEAGRTGHLPVEGYEIPAEFYFHWMAVTGEKPTTIEAYFSCGC